MQNTDTGVLKQLKTRFQSVDGRVRWSVIILLGAVLLALLMVRFQPAISPKTHDPVLTAVRVITVVPGLEQLTVRSQGTVKPHSESALTPEVSGSVVWISESLVSGGVFKQGDDLLRINDSDYRNAAARNRVSVTRAEVELELAESDYKRQSSLVEQKLTSQSLLDTADRTYRVAQANLAEARINLEQAELDLQRTIIHAPFAGRVRSEHVDLGQYISRGESVASLYATDILEVRLPIANQQFAYLDISISNRGVFAEDDEPEVVVHGEYASQKFSWRARLVRTEAEIDAKSRMFYGVARIDTAKLEGDTPPPIVGLFVHAEIYGRSVANVVRLPRSAIRDGNKVLVVDAEDRLRFRQVDILRIDYDEVMVSGGLSFGERVNISPLPVAVDGMKVKPLDVSASAQLAELPDNLLHGSVEAMDSAAQTEVETPAEPSPQQPNALLQGVVKP
ncbi:MAG: efflux RND transporter periplasmic adaptor subunit [Pseudomonadales bacterium]